MRLNYQRLLRDLDTTEQWVKGKKHKSNFLRVRAHVGQKHGHQQQQLRIAYNKAWTAFWWFDDFTEFTKLYEEVERLALAWHVLEPKDEETDVSGQGECNQFLNDAVDVVSVDSFGVWLTGKFAPPHRYFEFNILAPGFDYVGFDASSRSGCYCETIVGHADQGAHDFGTFTLGQR